MTAGEHLQPSHRKLRLLHKEIGERLHDKRIGVPPELDRVVRCAFPLLRSMIEHAQAIDVLASVPNPAAAAANVRSLFEAWADYFYLLLNGDPVHNAEKYLSAAMLEIVARYKDYPSGDAAFDAKLGDAAERMRQQYSAAWAEVERQRKQKKFHWSGVNWTAVIKWVGEQLDMQHLLADWYRTRSWDTHHSVMVLIRYKDGVPETGGSILYGHDENLTEDMDTITGEAYELLLAAWQQFCSVFSVPPL